jgi:hypothetical protein
MSAPAWRAACATGVPRTPIWLESGQKQANASRTQRMVVGIAEISGLFSIALGRQLLVTNAARLSAIGSVYALLVLMDRLMG